MNGLKIHIVHLFTWTFICTLSGILIGSIAAVFLSSLDFVTQWRETHLWIIYTLPIIGLLIGAGYYYFGGLANKGNNLIIEAYHSPQKKIPFRMAPFIFIGTLLTHLAGGSAGREGTAVQMGAAIADQFTKIFSLQIAQRKTILIIGISAGFAAVFGTPMAAAIFAMEIMLFKNCKLINLLPSLLSAYIAHYTCLAWGIQHTTYIIPFIPFFTFSTFLPTMVAGVFFGMAAWLFSSLSELWLTLFNKIKFVPLRPFIGGIVIVCSLILLGYFTKKTFLFLPMNTSFIGLGIPHIINSFLVPVGSYDFLLKLILTTFTLSAGFKGGEVTPLFYIGATLGNALFVWLPLPMALLAGMGFVAVFSGATHCVVASVVLGFEMFGFEAGIFVGLTSIIAYFFGGAKGIYSAQLKEGI